jgi:hypothetical protein
MVGQGHVWGLLLPHRRPPRAAWEQFDTAEFAGSVDRALSLVPGRRLMVVLTVDVDEHMSAHAERLGAIPMLQAGDRGTAPALAEALLRINDWEPRATVLVLPQAALGANRHRLAHPLAKAAWGVRRRPEVLVMIGAHPRGPVVRQPWIQPGDPINGLEDLCIRTVKRFVPHPSAQEASQLSQHDGLTGTQLMVGMARRLLELGRPGQPRLIDMPPGDLPSMIPTQDDRLGVLALPDALPHSRAPRPRVLMTGLCLAVA